MELKEEVREVSRIISEAGIHSMELKGFKD